MKINNKYEILSPEGFVDFVGVNKLKKSTIELFFDNGLTLRGSGNHKIYDYDGVEMTLSTIKVGDKIKSENGYLTVIKIVKHKNKTNVYDIVNSGELHLYYSNNIISHNCSFVGSGDSVIPSDVRKNILENMIKPPVEKYMSGELWVWKEPIRGHRYILGGDVSGGNSEDFSAFSIIDFDDREQVVEYVGKMPPDDFASVIYRWATMYSAFVVIDITGGMGVATSRKLQELGYRDMFIDGTNVKNIWEYNPKMLDRTPGIFFNNKRVLIVSSFEEHLRNKFVVRSQRLYNEIETFVYIHGRPDHIKGAHDDAIMSIAIALYVGDISFSQLKKNEDINKTMLESWTVSETKYNANDIINSNGKDLDAVSGMIMGNNSSLPQNVSKSTYQEYSWLFGGKPK